MINVLLKYGFNNDEDKNHQASPSAQKTEQLKDLYNKNLGGLGLKISQVRQIERELDHEKKIQSIIKKTKETDFSNFKMNESKEEINKKRFLSPLRDQISKRSESVMRVQFEEKESDTSYQIDSKRKQSQPSFKKMSTSRKASTIVPLRSQTVTTDRRSLLKNDVGRFYDYENERSKSRINQLLNQPIEIPNYQDSSFLKDGMYDTTILKRKPKAQVLPKLNSEISLPKASDSNQSRNNANQQRHYTQLGHYDEQPYQNHYSTMNVDHAVKRPDKLAYQNHNLILYKDISQSSLRVPSRNLRIRKLAEELKSEPNAFNRQKILFQMVEQAEDEPIGLSEFKTKPQVEVKYSPLKNEKPDSSIIKEVVPAFPFHHLNNENKNAGEQTQQQFYQMDNKLNTLSAPSDNPCDKVAMIQSVQKTFEVKAAKYNKRLGDMNEVLEQRIFEVQKAQLDDNVNRQIKQDKDIAVIKQRILFCNKKNTDFEILEWHKLQNNLTDYRGISIDKHGYQLEQHCETTPQESESNSQIIPNSMITSQRRRDRHSQCLLKKQIQSPLVALSSSPVQSLKKSPTIIQIQGNLSPRKSITKLSFTKLDQESSASPKTFRKQSTFIEDKPHHALDNSKNTFSSGTHQYEFDHPQKYQLMNLMARQSTRKSSIKKKMRKRTQEEIEFQREEELRLKREKEHQEYFEEMKEIRNQELLLSARKFASARKDELYQVNKEIEDLEHYSDDEFDIYQNNAIANAFSAAKKKFAQKTIREQQILREKSSMSPLSQSTKKQDSQSVSTNIIQVIPTGTSTRSIIPQQQISLSSTPNLMQPHVFQPIIQSQFYATPQAPSVDSQYIAMQAVVHKPQNITLKEVHHKQKFNEQLLRVYQKNENVDYDKQLKQIRRLTKKLNLADIQAALEREKGHSSQEEDKNEQSSSDESEEQQRFEEEYLREQFDKEEAMENTLLQKRLIEEQRENMERKYLQMCKNEKVLPLPIINKIFEGVLSLDDYKLNYGLCKALGNVLEDLGDSIHKIDLRNNGIVDVDYAEIIKGALKNPHIRSLAISKNEFKEESLNELLKYFKDRKKHVLQELVIAQCKTKLSQINELLKVLSDYNHLHVLAICQAKLDKQSVKYLGDIANGNMNLRELDLSWNEVTSWNMWELVQNIEFCRQISYLNLSFNSFAGSKTNDIVESLCNFIRRNRSLIHLDISYCGLKKDEVFQVVKACKKSRSLLSIHLTGNLVTDETKQKIREFMRPRKRVKDLYDLINDPDASDQDNVKLKIGNIDLAAAIQAKLRQYQQEEATNNGNQNNGGGNKDSGMKGQGDSLIFSRILGHLEIPRSHKWQETQECWICERYRYTCVIMSKSIADTFFVKPLEKDREMFIQKIKDAKSRREENLVSKNEMDFGSDDDEMYYDADNEDQKHQHWLNNQVTGTFSRWKCRSVLPLGEFIKRVRKNQEPSVKVVQVDKDIYQKQVEEYRAKTQIKDQLNKKFRRLNALRAKNFGLKIDDEIEADWEGKLTAVDYEFVKSSWIYELQSQIPYKDSVNHLISLDKLLELNAKSGMLSELKEKVYVYADYLPPGKHNTCLLYNSTNTPMKGMYTFVTPVRPRELPLKLNHKRVKEYRITRKFDKPNSMFKDYLEDTPALLKRVLMKDLESWKLGRVIKDQFELRRVLDTLLEYTEQIKDMFNHSIALSSFPSISWIDFGNMCTSWKILDTRTCTMLTIDRLFIATNVELIEQEDNPDRDLCRFEFYEIITRLGNAKYKDSGQVKTWDEALRLIIENNLIPNCPNMGGQSFRNSYIWKLAIDDLFRANSEHLQKLFKKYTTDRKCHLDLQGCLEMVENLQIPETEIRIAYSFAKMTIIDEMNQKDKYDNMLLCEMLDFICRCAYFKYKDQNNIQFVEKVEKVLDVLFRQIEMRRERPNFEIEVSSDSNYSSDD